MSTIMQQLNKVEFLEELDQHTCPDCVGHGEVQEARSDGHTFSETKVVECINCEKGYV